MIKPDQYVPILKGKRGEFNALAKLPMSVLNKIVPIIDLVPPKDLLLFLKEEKSDEEYQKYLKKFFNAVIKYLKESWRRERLLYLDGHMIQDLGMLKNDYPFEYVFKRLLSEGFNIIPVISNSTGSEHNEVVKKIIPLINKGVCIRLVKLPNADFDTIIKEQLNFLEMQPKDIDLIIDLRSFEVTMELKETVTFTAKLINKLSYLDKWRSFVLSGSVFPLNLMDIPADEIFPLERIEWLNWQELVKDKKLDRIPSYSDYGISHPLFPLYDEENINASASIRYTGNNYFYIYRGRGTRQLGFEQFFDLSEMLINRPEFEGRKHCFGDNYIYLCGIQKSNTGNLEKWRLAGTNHHITKVTDQLRQFFLDFNI